MSKGKEAAVHLVVILCHLLIRIFLLKIIAVSCLFPMCPLDGSMVTELGCDGESN